MTLAESMALAVLRGDMVAAYALADKICEERKDPAAMHRRAEETRHQPMAADGFAVYRWPEFDAFCRRAGILWDLRTVSMTFTIAEGEFPVVEHRYAMSNVPPEPVLTTTTTLQNETCRTNEPGERRPPEEADHG